ncbi:MAG: GNAT family N-acetyltransferase [Firmicutes bacterium]|nr:GNAT family N-acetyltransferase [Bacillota bacterium]
MELIIKNAAPDELPIGLDLMHKAASWLKEKHMDYWPNWLTPSDAYVAWIKEGFDKREFYFAYTGDDVLAGMYRLQYADEGYWGRRNDKAGYIHSLTTNRAYKGHGIGYAIVQRVEEDLAKKGFEYLRLDCSPDEGICGYYERYGFAMKGSVSSALHGRGLRLYEKKIEP